MIAELTKAERQGALIILLALAVTGLAMAAAGSNDPFGVHGALVMVTAIVGIFAVISGYYAPEPSDGRLDSYYDTPTKFGIIAAMASLADKDFVPAMQPKFKAGRERLYNVVKGLGRKIASNPQASFVFFEVGMPNKDFAAKMAAEGVRVVGRSWPEYDNWTRICVGEDWEMDRCEAALKKVLAA